MSFRLRLTLMAAAAVAVAVAAASAVVYVVVRDQLRSEIDESLRRRADAVLLFRGGPPRIGLPRPRGPFGGPDTFVQLVRDGPVGVPPVDLPGLRRARLVAAGERAAFFTDGDVRGVHVRVYTAPVAPGLAVQAARPLTEVDQSLRRVGYALVGISLGGIGLAAALGLLVARAALAPVRRLTSLAEEVAATQDLTKQIDVARSDELGRLAASLNTMLEALDRSVRAQRQLVADASHELRTPLASLRTNVEVLAGKRPLSPEEHAKLLDDLKSQAEELSELVSDLVELDRAESVREVDDLRLDEVVAELTERARNRSPGLRFEISLEPVVVRGSRSRIARAVSNLLDNAGKWSPPGGVVEVGVSGGAVTVRDHGPGFDEVDLPHVFDRFYRAASARGLPGAGLGLAIVRQVAEEHGGSATAENAPGGGAKLRIILTSASDSSQHLDR